MTWSLLDIRGRRKYLTSNERAGFIRAAYDTPTPAGTFCLTLAITGARISEVLALTRERFDQASGAIVFETLKRRRKGVFRAVPVPVELFLHLDQFHRLTTTSDDRIWPFSRPTAWKYVKAMMATANTPAIVSQPRALRHAFGVEAVQQRIALSLIKKWLGHAKIETTAIYAEPIGEEERELARLTWSAIVDRPTTGDRSYANPTASVASRPNSSTLRNEQSSVFR